MSEYVLNALEARFCKISKKTNEPYDIIPGELVEYFVEERYRGKIAIINNQVYLYRDGVFELDTDGKQLKTEIGYLIPKSLIEISRINRVYDLILVKHAINREFSEMNQYPVEMINFKNGMLDTRTMELLPHEPEYLSTNQIPFDFISSDVNKYSGSVADQFFTGLIPDAEDRKMFFRFAGLCFGRDTRAQKLLTFVGLPATGKSVALSFLSECIGEKNISAVSMMDLCEKFYPTLLFGKTANICADLPKTAIEATDQLKKAVGEDSLKGEYKGGKIFFFKSYCKLIFSTNQLPQMLDEKSEAFFRRLLCIEVRHKPKYIDNLKDGLEASRSAFISECMKNLHEYYQDGCPKLDSPKSLAVVNRYYMDCDSVKAWIFDSGIFSTNEKYKGSVLFEKYRTYCQNEDITALSRKSFFQNLRGKDLEEVKQNGSSYFRKSGSFDSKMVYLNSGVSSTLYDENEFQPIPEDEEIPFSS